jgi:hypothetical protein
MGSAIVPLILLAWFAAVWGPRWAFTQRGSGTHMTVTLTNRLTTRVSHLELAVAGDKVSVPSLASGQSTSIKLDSIHYAPVILVNTATGVQHPLLDTLGGYPGMMGTLEVEIGSRRDGGFEGSVAAGVTYAKGPIYMGGPWPFHPEPRP